MLSIAKVINKRPDIINFLNSSEPFSKIFDLPNNLDSGRLNLYKSLYNGIGNTECLRLELPNKNLLYIKLECDNPMGNSHYSRYWIIHLFLAELFDIISPEKTNILEITSGSSGIALSMACEMLNYNVTILLPKLLPINRVSPMIRKNTELIFVDGFIYECNQKLLELLSTGKYFLTNHSEEKSDLIIHIFSRIGIELINQKIIPDYAFLGIGNGSTTESISKIIKANNPNCNIVGYHPDIVNNTENIVLGLMPPIVKLRHIDSSRQYLSDIYYTNNMNIEDINNLYSYDHQFRMFGQSTLYGIWLALKKAETNFEKVFISIAYDNSNRY
jgi:cysteine synthase